MTKPIKPNPFISSSKAFVLQKIIWVRKSFNHRNIEVAATLIAAIASLVAVWISFRALKSSNESIKLTKESLEISQKANKQSDSIFLEQKKQFEALNRPYLQIELDIENVSTENNWPTSANFFIKNLGKYPVNVQAGYVGLYLSNSQNLKFENINIKNNECLKQLQVYITDQTRAQNINYVIPSEPFTCPTKINSRDIQNLNENNMNLYFVASLDYQSLLDNSNYKYEVLIKITPNETEYICNRNSKLN